MAINPSLMANPQLFGAYQQDPRNAYAQALMQQGMSSAPVKSPLEGLARALTAGVGGYFQGETRRDYEAQGDKYRKGLAEALKGGDVIGALSASEDPYLQQTGMQAQLQRAMKDPTEQFATLTDDEEKAAGLDPSGVYQRGNLSGKVETLTAPQQKRKPGETRDFLQGGQKITEQWDGEKWAPLGAGPAYAPPDPKTTWRTVTDDKGKPLYQESNLGERKPLPGQESGGQFKQENTLRDEYNTLTKDFRTVQDAYNKLVTTSDTGAGDMSLLYSYVKLLDPGSVVRESEFATAAASGSYGERIQGLVQRILTGERLPSSLRQEFKTEAQGIYQGQKISYDNAGKYYGELATRAGIDPTNVVIPYATAPIDPAPNGAGGPAQRQKPKVLTYNPQTGKME